MTKKCHWCGKKLTKKELNEIFLDKKGILCDLCNAKGILLDVNSVGDLVFIRCLLSGTSSAPDCKGKEFRHIEMDGQIERIICPQPPCPQECADCNLVKYKGEQ